MKDWNLVVTSFMRQEHRLLRELAPLGEFRASGFAAVLVGKVPEVGAFLETLRAYWPQKTLSAGTPQRRGAGAHVLPFTPENLLARLEAEVRTLAPEIGSRTFYVRVKRRGHKGEIKSQEVEQTLARFLKEEFCRQGQNCAVDFVAAGVIVVVN